ncbi:hypothetical protein [Aquitalea sp.]|uniref:hypothetical protein n=1 Tax=Aquitalea sp. TaxID=1872623 RepID=UPI00258C2F94|nr:hypothetical protein [Aquitalea sp.]
MDNKPSKQSNKSSMTPLWVISLFLSLTEGVLGVGVIQTAGGIQIALASFVIIFPIAVAIAFFSILWFKPYVLYSPFEFGSAEDAATFIEAISRDAKAIQDKANQVTEAAEEIEALRSELTNKVAELEEKIQKAEDNAVAMSIIMS